MTELSLLGRIFDNVNVVICMTKTNKIKRIYMHVKVLNINSNQFIY